MKTEDIIRIPVEATGPLAEALKSRQAIEIMDGDVKVATVIPARTPEEIRAQEERIEELVRTGAIRRGPPPTLVEELIADRRRD